MFETVNIYFGFSSIKHFYCYYYWYFNVPYRFRFIGFFRLLTQFFNMQYRYTVLVLIYISLFVNYT